MTVASESDFFSVRESFSTCLWNFLTGSFSNGSKINFSSPACWLLFQSVKFWWNFQITWSNPNIHKTGCAIDLPAWTVNTSRQVHKFFLVPLSRLMLQKTVTLSPWVIVSTSKRSSNRHFCISWAWLMVSVRQIVSSCKKLTPLLIRFQFPFGYLGVHVGSRKQFLLSYHEHVWLDQVFICHQESCLDNFFHADFERLTLEKSIKTPYLVLQIRTLWLLMVSFLLAGKAGGYPFVHFTFQSWKSMELFSFSAPFFVSLWIFRLLTEWNTWVITVWSWKIPLPAWRVFLTSYVFILVQSSIEWEGSFFNVNTVLFYLLYLSLKIEPSIDNTVCV